jgi:hypothetical protein
MRLIDLRNKSVAQARRAVKRLNAWKVKHGVKKAFRFILPLKGKPKHRNFKQDQLKSRCPYCGSHLIATEAGIVCNGENLRDIMFEIDTVKKRYGEQAELFISTRANRFYGLYQTCGRDMRCDYILGNDEKKWRINNRILRADIDRKTIFSSKKK